MANKRAWKKRQQKVLRETANLTAFTEVLGQLQSDVEDMKHMYPKFYREYMDLKEHNEKRYVLQFVRLHGEIRDGIVKLCKKGMGNELGVKYLKMYYNTITDILEDCGVEILISREGERFDPKIHKLLSKVEIDRQELHGMIAEVVSPGYKWRELVLQKMNVAVYCSR